MLDRLTMITQKQAYLAQKKKRKSREFGLGDIGIGKFSESEASDEGEDDSIRTDDVKNILMNRHLDRKGVVMSKENHRYIIEPFYKLPPSQRTMYGELYAASVCKSPQHSKQSMVEIE